MIGWDQYKDKFKTEKKSSVIEDEIDISKEMGDLVQKPIEVQVQQGEKKNSGTVKPKKSITPFPWDIDKFYSEIEKVVLGEECKELENVLYTIKQR